MAILTAADQSTYFPMVTQTGAALLGLIALAQSMCESSYGANRSLELQQFTEIVSIHPAYFVATLSYYPISPLPPLQVEVLNTASGGLFAFGRSPLTTWAALSADEMKLDPETGDLWLLTAARQAKVIYTAGYDFAGDSAEVRLIKAIAGQVLTYFANYKVGLDSYLSNPPGNAVESYNLVRPDQYLVALLMPLRKYMPRRSAG